MAEIHEKSQFQTCCLEIVEQLSVMLRGYFFDRLYLQDDLFVTDEIGLVSLVQDLAL